MNSYSIVYIGTSDRAPFFGGAFWFDKGVPQTIRGDLAAQLLFTGTAMGQRQFQVETQADFDGMLAEGYIAPGTPADGMIWTPPQALVADAPAPDSGTDSGTPEGTDSKPAKRSKGAAA